MRLTGQEAIEEARRTGRTLSQYTTPIEEARDGLSVEEAEEIAAVDPSLIYLPEERTDDWTLTTYRDEHGVTHEAVRIPHTDGTSSGVRAAIEAAVAAGAPAWILDAEGAVDEDGEYLLGEEVIWDRLRDARLDRDLTQAEAAEQLGLSAGYYPRVERGEEQLSGAARRCAEYWLRYGGLEVAPSDGD